MTAIELVRHAKAHGREAWWGKPDTDRPLNQAGERQAAALAVRLAGVSPVEAVISSPYVRCTATVAPLAAELGLEVAVDEALGEAAVLPPFAEDRWIVSAWVGGRAVALVDRLVGRYPEGRVVACTHGDVIPALLAVLAGRDQVEIEQVRLRKGAWVTLDFDQGRCVKATPHPAPDSEDDP